ncbi:MAG: peptidoglycan-binding protein [Desulfosarcina sp.]|nr:peptidoglycan-binding protein [Desulfobacterales bacterium]
MESFEVYRRNIPEWRAIDLEAVGVLSVKSAFPVTVGRPIYYRFTFKEEIFANTGAATRRRDERMLKKRESSISQSKDFGVMRMFRIGEALYTIGTDVVMFKAELDRLTAGIQRLLKLEAFEGNDCNPVKPVHDSRQRIVEELRRPVNERLTIALVQQALNERSYDAGNADGRMGPLTRRALSNFQRVNGLAVTGGTIDSAVINALTIPKDPISHYLTQAASAQ